MNEKGVSPRRRKKLRCPPEALTIAQQKRHPVALCKELTALTGHDQNACWRFLRRHGIERPGSASRRKFGPEMTDSIVEYVSEHGVQAAAQRFRCEPKTLYNLFQRSGYTRRGRDKFSLREVCSYLGVRHSRVIGWIDQGLLQANRKVTRTGRIYYSIDSQALQKFCKEHRSLLVTRRWSPQRLAFLEEYVFAPKHADLLRTRESERESVAYERGEYLDIDENFQRRA